MYHFWIKRKRKHIDMMCERRITKRQVEHIFITTLVKRPYYTHENLNIRHKFYVYNGLLS